MAYLYRTCDATASGGYSQLWTWSGWVKRSKLGNQGIFNNRKNGSNTASRFKLFFNSDDKIQWECKDSGGSDDSAFQTNRKFKDTNAYYHIVFIYNSDNGTAADRLRLYVNGVRETSFASEDQASSGFGTLWSSSMWHYIGVANDNSGLWSASAFEGTMSHVHFAYGTAYEPSVFGETDSTTGEWKIKTSPTVTYGSQGYFMLKDDGSVNDDSGEGNNFQASGTIINSQDNPSNIFACANPLVRNSTTLSYGNLRIASGTSDWYGVPATLGVETGKFYWEYKLTTGNAWSQVGVMSSKPSGGYNSIVSTYVGNNSGGVALNSGNGDIYQNGSSGTTWFSGGLAQGDIIGVALDATNNKIYFAKNGSWGNSSNPATGTNGQTLDSNFTDYKPYLPAFSVHNCIIDVNFGNGYFGGTAISSAGTNASGIGIFEYDVPANFTALCAKGLNE